MGSKGEDNTSGGSSSGGVGNRNPVGVIADDQGSPGTLMSDFFSCLFDKHIVESLVADACQKTILDMGKDFLEVLGTHMETSDGGEVAKEIGNRLMVAWEGSFKANLMNSVSSQMKGEAKATLIEEVASGAALMFLRREFDLRFDKVQKDLNQQLAEQLKWNEALEEANSVNLELKNSLSTSLSATQELRVALDTRLTETKNELMESLTSQMKGEAKAALIEEVASEGELMSSLKREFDNRFNEVKRDLNQQLVGQQGKWDEAVKDLKSFFTLELKNNMFVDLYTSLSTSLSASLPASLSATLFQPGSALHNQLTETMTETIEQKLGKEGNKEDAYIGEEAIKPIAAGAFAAPIAVLLSFREHLHERSWLIATFLILGFYCTACLLALFSIRMKKVGPKLSLWAGDGALAGGIVSFFILAIFTGIMLFHKDPSPASSPLPSPPAGLRLTTRSVFMPMLEI